MVTRLKREAGEKLVRYGKLIAGLALAGVVLITFVSLTAYHFVKRAFGNVYSASQPAPGNSSNGTPEQAAVELAKRVMTEDEQSTAALLTAVQMSGFSVRADDGSLAYESVTPGQGIIIDAWEVAALAKVFADGLQINLSDLGNA